MIKSLLYYIALLLFVIYNCNTPLNYIKSFIPPSVGKYLLGFPAFIVVTTILVVYPILSGKELLTFDTDSSMTNIFRPDTTDSVNRSAIVIDDSGEIILEKSSDVNKNFSDLVTSLRADLAKLNSKVNNNTNILKTQIQNFTDKTNSNFGSINEHFSGAANWTSAITPAPVPPDEVECRGGNPAENRLDTKMCKRKKITGGDAYKDKITSDWHGMNRCPDFYGAAWLTPNRNDFNQGHYACIRNHGVKFKNAELRYKANTDFISLDFNNLQTN